MTDEAKVIPLRRTVCANSQDHTAPKAQDCAYIDLTREADEARWLIDAQANRIARLEEDAEGTTTMLLTLTVAIFAAIALAAFAFTQLDAARLSLAQCEAGNDRPTDPRPA